LTLKLQESAKKGEVMTNFRTVSIGIGSTLLALTLIGLGLVEWIDPAALGSFAIWGYPQRFHGILAIVEICGGLLLLLPVVAWYSAACLSVLLACAIGTYLWNGQAQPLMPAGVLLAGVLVVGYARHPNTVALSRLRAVADEVAEREIAQQRQRLAAPARPRTGLKATSAKTRPAGRASAATNSVARNS
jgi:uncharacterized membrane protein YphA (DoxX/SURF4 family)